MSDRSPHPETGPEDAPAAAARMLVEHATRLAGSDLDGIEKAASEIAALAEGNGTAITAAYRLAMTEARSDHTTTAKQVVAIVRRAIEIGMSRWDFEETAPPP